MAETAASFDELVSAIRRYVATNPRARDSANGVARWWIGRPSPEESVQEALRWLVAEGTLIQQALPDGTIVYASVTRH
jgi:hypothetical protein